MKPQPRNRFAFVTLWLAAAAAPAAFAQNCTTTAYPAGLQPAALDADSHYGASVALSNNRAIVGAPDEDGKGAAFIHDFSGSTWSAGLRLQSNELEAGDHFGAGVAVDGDWALVGAPDDDDKGVDAGAVYVYRRIILIGVPVWVQSAKLYGNDTVAGDRFGAAVAMKGGRAAIGAPNDNIVFFHQGSAYAFELSGTTWSQMSKLTASGSQVNENFGSAVTIDGDYIAVGGPNWDWISPSKIDAGRVAVFLRITNPSTGWFLDAVVNPADPVTSRHLGASVALEGTRLLIGAPGAWNFSSVASGACYVFETVGIGAWLQKAKLLPILGANGDLIGSGVALAAPHAFVATKDGIIPYDLVGLAWTEKAPLVAPFADFQSGGYAKLGPVVAANATHLIDGRPSAGAGDLGTAIPFAVCGGSWSVLGGATLGTGGIPKLRGAGPLDDNLPLELRMKSGKPNAAAVLLVHVGAPGNVAFHGGILTAFPVDLTVNLPLSPTGELTLPAVLPAGLVNVQMVMQVLVADPLANGGICLSNGTSALTAP